eukprot:CAMPEP_0168602454 /NCGR_PEP_ID=MMETSP0420-20121227/14100_1 /TAXON_ID=498008 /ORGANISM="Pessonella sp." /LENGTH=472 /DNA_ID=CAMNT_0008641161 /DNA_START=8 /DNA_END=1427 /DNA_ORIENTATION=+
MSQGYGNLPVASSDSQGVIVNANFRPARPVTPESEKKLPPSRDDDGGARAGYRNILPPGARQIPIATYSQPEDNDDDDGDNVPGEYSFSKRPTGYGNLPTGVRTSVDAPNAIYSRPPLAPQQQATRSSGASNNTTTTNNNNNNVLRSYGSIPQDVQRDSNGSSRSTASPSSSGRLDEGEQMSYASVPQGVQRRATTAVPARPTSALDGGAQASYGNVPAHVQQQRNHSRSDPPRANQSRSQTPAYAQGAINQNKSAGTKSSGYGNIPVEQRQQDDKKKYGVLPTGVGMKTTAPGYGDLPQATWKDTKQDVRKSTVSSGSVPGYGSKPVAQPNGALDDEINAAIRKAQRTARHRPARRETSSYASRLPDVVPAGAYSRGNTYGAPTNLYGNVPTGNYTRPGGATRQKSGTVLQVGDLDNKLIGAIKANPYGAPAGAAAAPAAAAGAFVCDHPGCKGSYHTREDLEFHKRKRHV